ncbi:hypothetical protein K504DRAFT_473231 [Pleomassaria siparia CBS 279.74]|uniref:Uncharacterized protein n=1 Tax=Pleomassaria siparia CBS 279.74 TaxID=1314801 RepID=A0A6G1KMH7_9PLEO|nr:hypothetical protein K504DRAFT_473231 [Pleomassaria siparia CBS 279.74]
MDEFGSLYVVDGSTSNANKSLDLRVLGVNRGASLDRVDCVLVRYQQEAPGKLLRMELIQYDQVLIPPFIQAPILHLIHTRDPSTVPQLHATLSHLVSAAVKTFCKNHNLSSSAIDIIASRSLEAWLPSEFRPHLTSSFDSISSEQHVVATETGITTVTDFRLVEHVAGRHGVPPLALIDGILLRDPTKLRACQNIGTVTNLCFIPPESEGGDHTTVDWNCGLGNALIDAAMRHYTSGELEHDHDGEWGARGIINHDIVDGFFQSSQHINHVDPESTTGATLPDNDPQKLIDECMFLGMSKYDTIATLTRITARNIENQYRMNTAAYLAAGQQVDELFLCGAGARNPNLLSYLKSSLPETSIKVLDDIGIPGAAEEGVILALHALQTVLSACATQSETLLQSNSTRAQIAPGKHWGLLVGHILRFSEGNPLPPVDRIIIDQMFGVTQGLNDSRM